MWHFIGLGVGVALGMGFAGDRGQGWAVRALCAVVFVIAAAAALFFALVGGKDSPVWDAFGGGVLSFALVSLGSGLSWAVAWARGRYKRNELQDKNI